MDRPFYPEKIFPLLLQILPYLVVTFEVMLGVLIVGLVLGFLLAKGSLSKKNWKRKTAGFIINCLETETTPEEIVAKMAKEYDAPRDVLERDALKIIDQLRKIGAIDE